MKASVGISTFALLIFFCIVFEQAMTVSAGENQCEYQKAVDRIRKTEGILKDEVKGDMVQAKYKDTSYDECKSMCDDNDKCMNFEHCPDRGLCRLFDQEVYPSEAIGNLQQFFDCSSYLKTCTNA